MQCANSFSIERISERIKYKTGLLPLIESWKKSLDNKGFGGAILMTLSKPFDTLNHEILTAKLHTYGFDEYLLKLLHSHLSDR